jgi:NADH-quinone oxidoreductase subunit J
MSPTSYQTALPRSTDVNYSKTLAFVKTNLLRIYFLFYNIKAICSNLTLFIIFFFKLFLTLSHGKKYNWTLKKMAYFLFFALSIICITSVLFMILIKDQAYNALFIVLAFACLAGLFALLDAPFIAVVQIIIYAGAIMVLFVFVIMMINLRTEFPTEKKKLTLSLSLIIGIILFIELIFSLKEAFQQLSTGSSESIGNPTNLGELLFTKYLYPFEITSVLIIAAMVGAIVLAKKKEIDKE